MPELSFAPKGIEDLTIPHQVEGNPLTGVAMIGVPLPATPGRGGFGPALSLNYSSSGGNSAFGIGWSLGGVSSIGRSPKQLPTYNGKDKFVFNGSDELVPTRSEDPDGYRVQYFRGEVERSFVRFEQWTHIVTGRIYWRSWDRDGTLTIYGQSDDARIADPDNPYRTYLWLAEAQFDRYGNVMVFDYVAEDAGGVNFGEIFEHHRRACTPPLPQRYLKRVRYGNTRPAGSDRTLPTDNEWLFELVFDYGDHDDSLPLTPDRNKIWKARSDPHSDYRPGFEVRTYRLCRRGVDVPQLSRVGA